MSTPLKIKKPTIYLPLSFFYPHLEKLEDIIVGLLLNTLAYLQDYLIVFQICYSFLLRVL